MQIFVDFMQIGHIDLLSDLIYAYIQVGINENFIGDYSVKFNSVN